MHLIAATLFKLTDLAIDIPSLLLGLALLGTIYKVAEWINKSTNKFRDFRQELAAADSAINKRVDRLSNLVKESARRTESDRLRIDSDLKDLKLRYDADLRDTRQENKEIRSKIASLEGFLAKQGYSIREPDR